LPGDFPGVTMGNTNAGMWYIKSMTRRLRLLSAFCAWPLLAVIVNVQSHVCCWSLTATPAAKTTAATEHACCHRTTEASPIPVESGAATYGLGKHAAFCCEQNSPAPAFVSNPSIPVFSPAVLEFNSHAFPVGNEAKANVFPDFVYTAAGPPLYLARHLLI
jgi:hypothetical protein